MSARLDRPLPRPLASFSEAELLTLRLGALRHWTGDGRREDHGVVRALNDVNVEWQCRKTENLTKRKMKL